MATGTANHFGLGRVGVWTFALDLQPMRKAQEAAQELEQLGYGCIWVPEAVGREPFASCALLLSGTKRIGVATGIASMYARSAITMQAGWRTLTEAFGERFTLGIGASHEHMATKLHKSAYDKPYSTMVAYLDQMDKGLYAAAAPASTPRRVLAALGPRMLALSAERGLGAHPYFVPPEHTHMARGVLGDQPLRASSWPRTSGCRTTPTTCVDSATPTTTSAMQRDHRAIAWWMPSSPGARSTRQSPACRHTSTLAPHT
jgi:probable F420-dependent oxidoreductase